MGFEAIEFTPELVSEMTALRRDIHTFPELAYQETRTSGIVESQLRELGCEVTTGIAGTGVVGVMDFGPGPTLGLRADMDALPMHEETGCAHASQTPGIMHACGHDGHTTILLMAARALAQAQQLSGKLVLIFQPAEENEGGARAMVEAGVFEQFPGESVYGLHNMPGIPVGEVGATPGPVSAAFDTFEIAIKGAGGHGAMPELCTDPVVASAGLITALNTIVSRNVKPIDAAVVTAGVLKGEGAYNVIPDSVTIQGSCRTLRPHIRDLVEKRIHEVCAGIGAAYGTQNTCIYDRRYPPVINAEKETAILVEALRAQDYPYAIHEALDPVMGSEDFAYFLEQVPGCYILLGAGETGGYLHSVTYDFNDDALVPGARIWTSLTQKVLGAA
ncbi:MAG: amidohydrolase [Pseudomonadota bacterium]